MCTIIPRSGGDFRKLNKLNNEDIIVKELSDIRYYDRYPNDLNC